MIDDCSLEPIQSLILISRLHKVPVGRWATPITCGLRRRAAASEMLAIYGIACHTLGFAIVLPVGRYRSLLVERALVAIEGELSFEVTEFFFFGFWCAAVCLHSFE